MDKQRDRTSGTRPPTAAAYSDVRERAQNACAVAEELRREVRERALLLHAESERLREVVLAIRDRETRDRLSDDS